jgi:diguanylate cyclase (GGDEF)-like protein
MARLEQVCASAQRYARRGALLFMDLDRFKNINDSLGHSIGDRLLIEVARRLENCMRASDTVARIGGDEFVVLLPEVDDAADVATAARKIVAQFVEPIRLRGHMLHTTPSIGIAMCPNDGASPEEILKSADTAMYRAKGLGGNNYQFFTKAMNEAAAERLRIEAELRQALEKGELSIHWQPQVDLRTGSLAGFEVLARWRHPQRGYIPPDKFIPVAEETGLIAELGEFVLRLACRQGREMIDGGCAIPRIAVNLSARQAHGADFIERVAAILAESRLPDGVLAFEITESAVMEQPEPMVQLLHKLRAMAIHLAVDDFGTGYSSLSYLKLFPIHHLKIDRSFVKDIEFDPNDRAIAISTIALAHSLGLQVVAEGVESPGQVDVLQANGCDEVQGYFYARPMPADQVPGWVAAFGRNLAQPLT